jgi:hypothetical protein
MHATTHKTTSAYTILRSALNSGHNAVYYKSKVRRITQSGGLRWQIGTEHWWNNNRQGKAALSITNPMRTSRGFQFWVTSNILISFWRSEWIQKQGSRDGRKNGPLREQQLKHSDSKTTQSVCTKLSHGKSSSSAVAIKFSLPLIRHDAMKKYGRGRLFYDAVSAYTSVGW